MGDGDAYHYDDSFDRGVEAAGGPLSDSVTLALTPDEVDVLQDAIAGELARYLMHSDRWPEGFTKFDTLTEVGRKIGLEL
jgi:hypothetical protein